MEPQNREFFETAAKVLIRCFLVGIALLLVWFFAILIAGDWIISVNTRWFNIPRQQIEVVHYAATALLKIAIIIEFLIPYVCLRIVLNKAK